LFRYSKVKEEGQTGKQNMSPVRKRKSRSSPTRKRQSRSSPVTVRKRQSRSSPTRKRALARKRSPPRRPVHGGGFLNPAAQYIGVLSHAVQNAQQSGFKAAAAGAVQDTARVAQRQLAPATRTLSVANAVGLGSVRVPYTPLNVRQASAALGVANAGLQHLNGGN